MITDESNNQTAESVQYEVVQESESGKLKKSIDIYNI